MNRLILIFFLLFCSIATAQETADESNPIVASVIFYSQSYGIEMVQAWCAEEHPSSAEIFTQARKQWDEIHKPLWDKVPEILQSNLSRDERVALAVQAKKENSKIVRKLASSPKSERIKWCKEAPEKILSDQMVLMGREKLVNAILNYPSNME